MRVTRINELQSAGRGMWCRRQVESALDPMPPKIRSMMRSLVNQQLDRREV
jgi:hypothetical protein